MSSSSKLTAVSEVFSNLNWYFAWNLTIFLDRGWVFCWWSSSSSSSSFSFYSFSSWCECKTDWDLTSLVGIASPGLTWVSTSHILELGCNKVIHWKVVLLLLPLTDKTLLHLSNVNFQCLHLDSLFLFSYSSVKYKQPLIVNFRILADS